MTDTKRMREIADLDSRAGAPVGAALRAAADRIDELESELARAYERGKRDVLGAITYECCDGEIYNKYVGNEDLREFLP